MKSNTVTFGGARCTCKNGLQASFYRFHIDDEINFSDDIRVTL